jgi:hypothetical protein
LKLLAVFGCRRRCRTRYIYLIMQHLSDMRNGRDGDELGGPKKKDISYLISDNWYLRIILMCSKSRIQLHVREKKCKVWIISDIPRSMNK